MRYRVSILIILLTVVVVWSWRCGRLTRPDQDGFALGPGETARVTVEDGVVTKVSPDGTETRYAPDEVVVVVGPDKVDVYTPQFGWKIEPGIGIVGAGSRAKVVADVRLFHAGRFGGHIGVSIDPWARRGLNVARGIAFVGYRLPYRWASNTSLTVGHEIPGPWTFGLRWRF